jgi:hypothetical protein
MRESGKELAEIRVYKFACEYDRTAVVFDDINERQEGRYST